MTDLADDAESEALSAFDVSRETLDRLRLLVAELRRWQGIKNLVGPGTLDAVWTRHIADSLQLLELVPKQPFTWLDLGSGAGFPGLVVAIAAPTGSRVHLVESNSRKCAFLRHAARATGAPAQVHESRIEDIVGSFVGQVDVVTARALAPLTRLLDWSAPLLKTGAIGVFPKGRDALSELTEAQRSWRFQSEAVPSRTDSQARILRIADLASPS
jgi:16S rRNA (guanine527-N7)-methyltransferase